MDIGFFAFVVAIALMAAIGVVLLLVGYIVVVPASIVRGWWWAAFVVFLPILGPIFFCRAFPEGLRKTRLQIFYGTLLLMGAAALLYGAGPWFAQHMVDAAKAAG
jgi:hypothetical protein